MAGFEKSMKAQMRDAVDISNVVPRRQNGGTPEGAINTTHIPPSRNIEDRRDESPEPQFDSHGLDLEFLKAEKYKRGR